MTGPVGDGRAERVQAALYRIAELASSARDMHEFYREVHAVVGELMYASNFFIALYDDERRLISWPYYVDEIDPDIPVPDRWEAFGEGEATGTTAYVLRAGEPQLLDHPRLLGLIEEGEIELRGILNEDSSWLGVPLEADGRVLGVVAVQSYTRDVQYTEADKDLLAFVGRHIGGALSRARAIEETRQRNAELALINSVQEALAGELELQAIYDVVGEKLREIFDAQIVDIGMYDAASGLIHFPYTIERGVRYPDEPISLIGFRKHVIETGRPLLIDEGLERAAERYGNPVLVGEMPKSVLYVPLVAGGSATGVISLQNIDREHAFSDSDRRLLETLARSLSVALENARLVDETRQRIAELALINSVQAGLAGELELQAIYDLVGDRIQEIFDAQVVDIGIFDFDTGLVRFPYTIERGVRFPDDEPFGLDASPLTREVIDSRQALLVNDVPAWEAARGLKVPIPVGEPARSILLAPLINGEEVRGRISLQNLDRTNAFSDDDVRLLTTLASSLSVALENARLVHETRQRNAELALINSVQESIAGELDQQAIYDVVGDKIQEIFDAQVVDIGLFDFDAGLIHYPYAIERGVRFPDDPGSIAASGLNRHLLETRSPFAVDDVAAWYAERGEASLVRQGEPSLSVLIAPLVSGNEVSGRISLQNLDRTHAFTESDVRLLTTLASSLSVALENARLVHETRQRNAELALINSVQESIAGELDQQAIYDVVGEKLREVFDAQVVDIGVHDEAEGILRFVYQIERGVHFPNVTFPVVGFRKHVLETRRPLAVLEDMDAALVEYGNPVAVVGEPSHGSAIFQPLVVGGRATGVISIQNLDREHAFGDADRRLLATIAGSLGVALENAQLVHETRQRNAELALINSVQAAIASELDPQAIYDLVGDRIRGVFDAQVVSISTWNEATGLLEFPYVIERGERLHEEPIPLIGFRKHVMETREPLTIDEVTPEVAERYGNPYVLSGEPVKSCVFVPLLVGGRATGVVSLQNVDRTHAFTESDRRLLATLAGSLSVALENARLVHETRQRNAELALINSVQQAIAGELDPQAIYDLVGDRIRDVFDAQVVGISMHDEANGVLEHPYVIEKGARLDVEPTPVIGFRKHVMETGEPLMINENATEEAERYGNPIVLAGDAPKSDLYVPLVVGGRPTGVIALQNVDREHAFTDGDRRLLVTLAGSVSVALENARLVHETRRRAEELATVNSVGQALAAQLDLDALIELVGERVRETFDADIAYVALHDEQSGKIDFVYYHESGERRAEPAIEYGEGLTSQILRSREPLLLNREAQYEGRAQLGTPSRSYLGVPILVGDEAIGVMSVQSINEEGRFGESETGLLATIASNVGIAIHNARLFSEIGRQKQYLESLVEITPVAVVTMDAGERVTGWNPAAAELFGRAAEEAIGRQIDDLVFGDDARDEGREITREALAAGRAQRITRRRRKDGTAVDVELMLVPLTLEGGGAGLLAIYHDITELQHAREEAEAATQAKSAFLATMSHEIRTPMNAVIGMTDLLLGTELSGEQREFAEVVRSSGDALLHVIDDILDYSKIEAGRLELEHEPFDLRECVEGALEIVAPRAWEKGIELGCLIDEGAPAGIVGDAARLRQVLLNLLSNAVKFTENGEVVVLVGSSPAAKGRVRLELAVRDTGIGIPRDRMGRLFTSFSQVDASTTRRYGGTGLGLAISKRLVELMGGSIRAESEEGSGSTFHISLVARPAELPARATPDDGLPQLFGKRVLIVDDNATNREIVTRHARAWRMEPVTVESGAAAIALVDAGEPFDVAVLDMMMPGMDGVELARELRSRRPRRELPLLLLTSLGRLPHGDGSGAFDAQLAKPLRASQLYNALVRLLTPEEEAAREVSEERPDADVSTLRILLAEDNAVNQKVALRLLERLGYGADVVSNGLEAIDALARRRYDVVLMDVQMPELDGLDASRRIRDRWPGTGPRIVAMTANALPEDREACFAAGMDDYVAKPIRPDALAAALKRVRPAGPEPAPPVGEQLDDAALDSLRELGGDDFLAEVIDTFLADVPVLLDALFRAIDAGDAAEARRAAHTLKSNGATLGATQFAELCRELEHQARDGRLEEAPHLVARIEEERRSLEQALGVLRPKAAT